MIKIIKGKNVMNEMDKDAVTVVYMSFQEYPKRSAPRLRCVVRLYPIKPNCAIKIIRNSILLTIIPKEGFSSFSTK